MTSDEAKKKMEALRREEEGIHHRMCVVMEDCTHRDEHGNLTAQQSGCGAGSCLGCGKYLDGLGPYRGGWHR